MNALVIVGVIVVLGFASIISAMIYGAIIEMRKKEEVERRMHAHIREIK